MKAQNIFVVIATEQCAYMGSPCFPGADTVSCENEIYKQSRTKEDLHDADEIDYRNCTEIRRYSASEVQRI